MPIRRINFTGRCKILREDVQVWARRDNDGVLAFEASVKLVDYGLPDDALVSVEAYRREIYMRFPHGTVAAPRFPGQVPCRLTRFTSTDGLLFRVKVTATGDPPGVLLAEADRIPVSDDEEQPDNRIALLPPAPAELGQETWRVDLMGANGPVLLINSRVGDWKAVAASPVFRSLVYPAAMRQVLWHIYKVEETRTIDDNDDWRCRWLTFAAALPGAGEPPLASDDDQQWSDWISSSVNSFAHRHAMLDHYSTFLAAERSA